MGTSMSITPDSMVNTRTHTLTTTLRLSLFCLSYLPMLLLMAGNQFYIKREFLNFGGFNTEALTLFVLHFGLASSLVVIGVLGSLLSFYFFYEQERLLSNDNGELVEVLDIENKNNESITYLFTYLIPFVFQDLSSLPSIVSVVVLLALTAKIYINSSMLLINPMLSLRYQLYAIEYARVGNAHKQKGWVVCKQKHLRDKDRLMIEEIGYKLFVAKLRNNHAARHNANY